MDASVKFLTEAVGLKQKFRDGDRYCAFECGALTLALVGREERIVGGAAMAYRVDDIKAAVADWTARGARVTREIERGPHEDRAVLALPAGGFAVISAKLK